MASFYNTFWFSWSTVSILSAVTDSVGKLTISGISCWALATGEGAVAPHATSLLFSARPPSSSSFEGLSYIFWMCST